MSVREALKHIKPPTVKYPDWLEKTLENPNQMSKLAPKQVLYIPPEYRQIRNIGYPLEPQAPAQSIIQLPPTPLAPKIPVKFRVRTNNGKPITGYAINVNTPENSVKTDEKGEVQVLPFQGLDLNWNGAKVGWEGSGLNRRRLEALIPLGGFFKVFLPTQIDIYPESGYSAINGVLQSHQIPNE